MLSNRSCPRAAVIPELAYPDPGEAASWLCSAFGFTLRIRIANHRVQLNVGDGALVITELGDGNPKPPHRTAMMIRVEDADAHCAQARARGANIVREPADH